MQVKRTLYPKRSVRRITGYLVQDTSRWNKYKKRELDQRVTHVGNRVPANI